MKELIGNIPKESGFISSYRKHQGWWRAFVLNEPEGRYFSKQKKEWNKVCNRIDDGDTNPEKKNFLSADIAEEVKRSLDKQKSGIIETERLYNNLLSSQPLAFNFFGFFRANPKLAVAFLRTHCPEIMEVEDIVYEFAPKSSGDNSAFDFGFLVKTPSRKGFIGFECKYTDTFSYKRGETRNFYGDTDDKNYENYYKVFSNNPDRFPDEYHSYVRDKGFNQLFRNEILGAQLASEFDFIITGLFCHHEDRSTVSSGLKFQKKIGNGISDFVVLTYADYFERMQKLDLSWEQRELVMMLWARYCGLKLSNSILSQ